MLSAPAPPRSTLPDSPERKPSEILLALVSDQGASVSSSFPPRVNLGGPPFLRRKSQKTIPHFRLWGRSGRRNRTLGSGGAACNVWLPRVLIRCAESKVLSAEDGRKVG
jgi:hypothetical protein